VTARQPAALDELAAEYVNLRLAWERAEGDTPLRIAAALTRFWLVRGYPHEGRAVLAKLLAEHADADPTIVTEALIGAGELALAQSDLAGARRDLERVLEAATPTTAASAHVLLSEVARRSGDLEGAERHCSVVVDAAANLDADRLLARARNILGLVALDRGDFDAAATNFREALAIAEPSGDVQLAAMAFGNLGVALMNLGEVADARDAFEASLNFARLIGSRAGEAAAFQNLAWATQIAEGAKFREVTPEWLQAGEFLRSAIAIYDELGYRRELAGALVGMTVVTQDKDEALWALARAEGLLRQLGDEPGVEWVEQTRRDFLEGCD
jgi:tetratricopeptide (TPR) repeat protein